MLTRILLLLAAAAAPVSPVASDESPGRALRYRVDVAAPIDVVWSAWTEGDRIREWFAPGSHIELRPLGAYEIFFNPDGAPGERGAEGNLLLALQAPEMLSFTWDAPPKFPEARRQRTSVVVRLERLGADRTRVWFEQTGWGRGGEWDETYRYFTGAWKYVLSMLHYRYEVGPVDWKRSPDETALAQHGVGVTTW